MQTSQAGFAQPRPNPAFTGFNLSSPRLNNSFGASFGQSAPKKGNSSSLGCLFKGLGALF